MDLTLVFHISLDTGVNLSDFKVSSDDTVFTVTKPYVTLYNYTGERIYLN